MRFVVLVALGSYGCTTTTTKDASGTLDAITADGTTETDADTDADADGDSDADTDADSDTDTTLTLDTATTTTTTCLNAIVDGFPADGSTDVYFDTEVWFQLAVAEPSATITVEDLYGNVVAGGTTVTDVLVTWAGDPLIPLTEYIATIDYGCGADATHFTTSDIGDPLTMDPTGLVYSIDLSTGVWAQPTGLGAIIAAQLGSNDLLLSPTVIGGTTIDLLGAYGLADVQDPCIPTLDFLGLGWTDPTVQLVAPVVYATIGGVTIDVTDVDVSGSFASDGSRMQFGTLRGTVDTRYLGSVLGLGSAPDAVCVLVSSFGLACDACPDGLTYCMDIAVDGLEAPNVAGTLVPRSLADILADATCP